MEFTVSFKLNDSQIEELKMLQNAMQKADSNSEYYTLEKVFELVMELGSFHRINSAIENAAYHYDKYYDNYPYKYGSDRTKKILQLEKEQGEYLETAYPNPTIVRY